MSTEAILAIVFGAPMLGLAALTFRQQFAGARLEYMFWSASKLVSVPAHFNVSVVVGGVSVTDAWHVTLRLLNSGRQDIDKARWESPLQFDFGRSSKPILAKISGVSPVGLLPTVTVQGTSVVVDPLLLNSGDMFEIQIVGEGEVRIPEVRSRISGIRVVRRRKSIYPPGTGPEGRIVKSDLVMMSILIGTMAILLLVAGLSATGKDVTTAGRIVFILCSEFAILVLFPLWIRRAESRRDSWRPREYL